MKRFSMLGLILLLSVAFTAGGAENAMDKSDRKALSDLITQWFHARSKEEMKLQVKTFESLKVKLADLQKRKKLDPLASPSELRTLLTAPYDPEKQPAKGRFSERELETGDKKNPKYLLWLPKNYSHDTALPVVIALHPALKKADDVKKWATQAFPAAIADAAIVIVPVNAENAVEWSSMEGRRRVFGSLGDVAKHFHVDRVRVFLDGEGTSAPAAVTIATWYPSLLTGVIVRRPESAPPSDQLENLRQLKLQILAPDQGDAAKPATAFLEDAKAKGVEAVVTATTFGEGGAPGDAGAQAIAAFIAGTAKNVAPKKLRFVAKTPDTKDAYWLTFDADIPKNGTFWIEAEVFSDKNEIKISSPPGMRSFTIFLNDDLVDMGKSVKVLHEVVKKDAEGKETREGPKSCFEGTKRRNLDLALQKWQDNSANYGEVYTNWIDVAF